MKKIKLATMAILSGLVFSCSSSDDGATTSGVLTRKWYHKESTVAGHTYPYDDNEPCGKDYIQFNADGTGEFVDIYLCDPYSDPFTYTRTGNNITVTTGDGPQSAQIVELSSTILKVKVIYDYDDDGDNDSVIEVYTSS